MRIREGRPAELAALQEIERRAGQAFASVGLEVVADDDPPSREYLTARLAAGRLWVAVDGEGRPVGYAAASLVDGEGHLDQVTVDPAHQGQGIGRALVERVHAWAAEQGLPAVTLTTYVDVPWNGPYYRRLGYTCVPDAELGPELTAIRAAERAHGLDAAPRTAMRRRVP